MARGARAYRFARFGRGYNSADGPYSLREGYADDPQGLGSESRALMNVVSRHRGNVSKRDGSIFSFEAITNPSTVRFKDFSVVGNDSSSFAVLSADDGRVYAVDANLTRTQIASGLSTTAPWTFLRHPVNGTSGPGFGINGTDTPRETDGTLAGTGTWVATTGTVPNGTLMEYHANTLWVAGVAATPYSLFWNLVGDPLNWPTANVTKFNPEDGLPLTALRSQGSYLLVFKERGIWAVFNEETSANRKFADKAGTLSPGSVVSTPLGCFFLDPTQGVMVTDGNDVRRVSAQIQPTLDQIVAADLKTVSAAYSNRHYYLAAKINNVRYVLDYDTELDSWWIHSPSMTQLAVWDRSTNADLYGVNSARGEAWQLFKAGELRDNGVIYESFWSGPYHTFGAPSLRKRCRQVHVDGRGKIDIYYATDYSLGTGTLEQQANLSDAASLFGGSGTFGGAGTFAGGGEVGEIEVYSLGIGRSWSMTFYSAREDYWELDAYTMSTSPRRD
jgi:hypothetical protein